MQPYTVVEGINNRDATAQKWVIDTFFPATFNTVKKITSGSGESEEMVWEVFTIFLEHPGPFNSVPAISEFLHSTASHIASKYNKKEDIKKRHADDLNRHMQDVEERNRENAEIDDHYNRIMYEDVEKLPRVTRWVFKLHYTERLTNEEIARKMGKSIRTVETQMSNAYRFLRLEVKKSGRDFIFTLFFIL